MKLKPFAFSRYNAPITNKYPSKVTTLYRIYIDITGNTLKKETLVVRADASKKPKILPYITASGIFKERTSLGSPLILPSLALTSITSIRP